MAVRILLVDDDRLVREITSEYLTAHDFIVDLAENGDEALSMFAPGKYRMAVLDLVMPGMSGLQLMEKIIEQDKEINCLIMTGYPTIDSAYKAMVEGVTDYIIKPFQLSELLEACQKYT